MTGLAKEAGTKKEDLYMRRWDCRASIVTAIALAAVLGCAPNRDDAGGAAPGLDDRSFWALVDRLSERSRGYEPYGGYRADNLVSNERGMQAILAMLARSSPRGAYIGVGPEQNYTLITALEPSIAFIVDIRRENLLLHLLYKALAEESPNRIDFLSRLFARPAPPGLAAGADVQAIFVAFEQSRWSADLANSTLRRAIARLTDDRGSPLSAGDVAGIRAIYGHIGAQGPGLRWDPIGGPWIPSYAELMTETDPDGVPGSYLATEETFRTFQRYHARNLIVPVVGDFGGTRALAGVANYLASHGLVLGTFYLSNVEAYLRGDDRDRFAANLAAMPRDQNTLLIRTRLVQTGTTLGRPDFRTTFVTERVDDAGH